MSKKIKQLLIIKGDESSNVRLSKYFRFFDINDINYKFIGWARTNIKINDDKKYKYLLSGGGFGGKILIIFYPLWLLKLFFYLLFQKNLSKYNIIAINFDSGLPLALVSLIKPIDFIYEIHDDFALSYNFHPRVKIFVENVDKFIKDRSSHIIHVDQNRIAPFDQNVIVIENSPIDHFPEGLPSIDMTHEFAVIGNISETRGINQIFKFATLNSNIKFKVFGKFYNLDYKEKFLKLPNIELHEYVPQSQLFSSLVGCSGIFSLYDPSLEINKKAASNKLYDAMMLGVPVITNKEVINSRFVLKNDIGFVLSYNHDNSWNILKDKDFLSIAKRKGINGRNIYKNSYEFDLLLQRKLIKILRLNETNYTRS